MKTYIGVKRIQAELQERNGKPGYRVIYEPDGYESWSPKDVVGRLLRVGGLDGVQGRGCMNNARWGKY